MKAAGAGTSRGLSPARAVLENGVTVLARQTRTTPAVALSVSLRAGIACDPPGQSGLAHFLSRTIDRGTERHTADAIAEDLDSRGVTVASAVGRHTLSLACTCLTEDFDHVLALVGDIVMRPVFPALEVDRRRGEIITLIRQDEDNPGAVAAETLMAALYGAAHPYGLRPRGSVESVGGIDRRALRQFHAAHCVPAALSLAVVGDVEVPRAFDSARAVFGEWRAAPLSQPPQAGATPPSARTCHVVPMMNKSQTDIAYGFIAIPRSDPEYLAHLLMNNILGQYSVGGRLGDRIREQQGMAYYVSSSLEANLFPGPFVVRAGVSAENVQRAVALIDAELDRLAQAGPTEQEMAESTQYLIGSMPRTLETNVGIAAYLQTLELFSLGLDYDIRVPELLRAVTREQVHRAAQRMLDPRRATVVVAGPYEGALT